MVQQQGHSHQTGNAGPMDHQSIQQQQQHQLQGQQGRVHGTPQGQQHYPPQHQHQQHNTQQAPHQQRGRGQGSKMSVKQRLGRGAGGGVQQNPQQGFQQQHQRGGMQHKRGGGRGQGNFQGGRNPNVPPNLRHPHPGGGDAPLLNPQSGISIEGLDQQTDGNLVMRMMISVGPVQVCIFYDSFEQQIRYNLFQMVVMMCEDPKWCKILKALVSFLLGREGRGFGRH
ncbi:hypothetical protein BSL78_06400 [Apostichopus japonicus]|uniref:Uncharacterized protein n=1 Tax=Stichopus japonicus TaxID=307972 RepID=A0A2G8L8T6_STIJA|nr:hypothetical protein BSL78_06400 [Apostichopus japonicus]